MRLQGQGQGSFSDLSAAPTPLLSRNVSTRMAFPATQQDVGQGGGAWQPINVGVDEAEASVLSTLRYRGPVACG